MRFAPLGEARWGRSAHLRAQRFDEARGEALERVDLTLDPDLLDWPWETRDDEAESRRISDIAHLDGGSVHTYATMIRQMDEGIGKLLGLLSQLGLREEMSSSTVPAVVDRLKVAIASAPRSV